MPIVVFNATSKRIGDIELKPGCTVKNLRDMLAAVGYDIHNAQAAVVRFQGKKLHGDVSAYVLRDGDIVEFETRSFSMKATETWLNTKCQAKVCACQKNNVSCVSAESKPARIIINGKDVAELPRNCGSVTLRIEL